MTDRASVPWDVDSSASDCACCSARFTVTKRKHHCRNCGRIVCGPCSIYRWALEGGKPIRFCVDCNCAILARKRGIDLEEVALLINKYVKDNNVQDSNAGIDNLEDAASKDGISMSVVRGLEVEVGTEGKDLQPPSANNHNQEAHLSPLANDESDTPAKAWRYLCILPAPVPLIVMTGLIAPSLNTHGCFQGLRFKIVKVLDEVAKIHSVSVKIQDKRVPEALSLILVLDQLDNPPATRDRTTTAGDKTPATCQIQESKFYIPSTGPSASLCGRSCRKKFTDTYQALRRQHCEQIRSHREEQDMLRLLKDTAPSWGDERSERLLRDLWSALQPDRAFPGPKSEDWTRIGFQGRDPITDFRGVGTLSLDCLAYWAWHRTKFSRSLVAQEDTRAYPVCCAGINLVNMIVLELGMSKTQSTSELFQLFCRSGPPAKFFQELLCTCFELLDYLFVTTKAGYMDFPNVLRMTTAKLKKDIAQRPVNVKHLLKLLDPHSPIKKNLLSARPSMPDYEFQNDVDITAYPLTPVEGSSPLLELDPVMLGEQFMEEEGFQPVPSLRDFQESPVPSLGDSVKGSRSGLSEEDSDSDVGIIPNFDFQRLSTT